MLGLIRMGINFVARRLTARSLVVNGAGAGIVPVASTPQAPRDRVDISREARRREAPRQCTPNFQAWNQP